MAPDPKPAHGESEMVPGDVPRNSSENTKDPHEPQEESIDPENEVKGVKLLIIHLSICLCTFLVGLVSDLPIARPRLLTKTYVGLQSDRNCDPSDNLRVQLRPRHRMVRRRLPARPVSHNPRPTQCESKRLTILRPRCSTQPLAGKTYILWSKKYCYLLWLGVFEVGSLVCALAPTSTALIVGRAVAGLGASGVFAGGFALLTTIIPLHKRAIYTGTMSSVFSIANIVGPPMGGAFTQNVTWRWCFYVNLPIGGFAAVLFFLLVHIKAADTERVPLINKLKGLDGLGFSLFAGSMIMFLLALQWGGVTYPWKSSIVIGLFVGFGVTLMLFIPWQMYMKDDALIPPKLFTTHRNVALICAGSFFINGPFQLVIYWLPVWFQAVMAATPVNSGTYYLPTVISDVLASFIGSGLVMQLGWWNPFLMLSEAFVCIGGGLLSTLYPGITSGHWIGYQILGGIGYALSTNLVSWTISIVQNIAG